MNHQNRMLKFKKGVGMALSLMLLCCTLLPTANVGAANPPAPTPASAAAAVTIEQETEIPLTEAEIEAMTDVAIAETATTAGDPTMVWDLPFVRLSHTAIYDSGGDRLIIFGGYNGREFFNDVWALDVSTLSNTSWAKLNPTGPWPAPRAQHTAIYDDINRRMIVFGGHSFHYNFDDVWALDLTTPGAEAWTQLFPSGQDPSARRWHTAVYDRDQNRMLVFGGGGNGGLFNDLWSLNLTPGAEAWTPIAVAGTVPAARVQHTAVYDDEITAWSSSAASLREGSAAIPGSGTPAPHSGRSSPVWEPHPPDAQDTPPSMTLVTNKCLFLAVATPTASSMTCGDSNLRLVPRVGARLPLAARHRRAAPGILQCINIQIQASISWAVEA